MVATDMILGVILASATLGSGNAGSIILEGQRILIRDRISTSTLGHLSGAAGSITVSASSILDVRGPIQSAAVETEADAGSILIKAPLLMLRNAGIDAGTFDLGGELSTGSAGLIQIVAENVIAKNSMIETSTDSDGDAGSITLETSRLVLNRSFISSGAVSDRPKASGRAGIIVVRSELVDMANAEISTLTQGSGDAGAITVEAGKLTLDRSSISSDAERGTGNAGPVLVRSQDLALENGGRISSDTRTSGDAGPLVIDAGKVTISGEGSGRFTGISSDARSGSSGDAGNILLTAGAVTIRPGGAIRSTTDGSGDAGQVVVVTDEGTFSGNITTSSTTKGEAGSIVLSGPLIVIGGGGQVGSSGTGRGPAGDVLVVADHLLLDGASIETSGEQGQGGRIRIDAGRAISLVGARIISDGVRPGAEGSIIELEAPEIVLNSSRVTSLTGDGEPITGSGEASLLGELTVISPDSEVAASSKLEVGGLESDVTAGLEVLPGTFLDVSGQLGESCAAQASEEVSSFVQTGPGSLALDVDGPLPGRYAGLSAASVLNAGPAANVVAHAVWPPACGG